MAAKGFPSPGATLASFGARMGEIVSRNASGEGDAVGEGRQPRPQAVAVLGAPIEAGAGVPGPAMGPAMLRTAGIVTTLRDLGCDVEDRGDLSAPPLVHSAVPEGKAHRFAHVSAGRDCWRDRPMRSRAPGGRRSCSAAIIAWPWARSAAWRDMRQRRGGNCSFSGSTPIRTSTRR